MAEIKTYAIAKTDIASKKQILLFKISRVNGSDDYFDKLGRILECLTHPFGVSLDIVENMLEEPFVVGKVRSLNLGACGVDYYHVTGIVEIAEDSPLWTVLPKGTRLKIKPKISYAKAPHFPTLDGPIDILSFVVDNELLGDIVVPKAKKEPKIAFGKIPAHFHKPKRSKTFVEPPKKR